MFGCIKMIMKIYPIIKENSSPDYHRLSQPLKYLQHQKVERLDECDIVFFSRELHFDMDLLLKARHKYGFKIVMDIDDYWELNVNHIAYGGWNKLKMPEIILKNICNADAVITTTDILANKIRKYNPEVHVIPNALPFGEEQYNVDASIDQSYDKLRMVYVGGQTHLYDLKVISNAFAKLTKDNVHVTLAGYDENHNVWNKMRNIISYNGRLNNSVKEGLPINEYMNLYNGSNIAIAPLVGNDFNSCKSNLKIIEAGCKRLPIIVSNVSPYAEDENEGIFKCSSTAEWYSIIKYLSNDLEVVKYAGERLYEYVKEKYDLIKVNKLREDLFKKLINESKN